MNPQGNPQNAMAMRFRKVLSEVVMDVDLVDVVRMLLKAAKTGQPWAVKELLDRVAGKAPIAVEMGMDGQLLVKFIMAVDGDKV